MDAPEINADDLKLREFACPDGSCGSDIFCSNSLGATGLNPTASQTVASMCALRGPGYFSESAADLLMAARFCNQTANFSTEPNTPWMLADYALSLSVQQDKLDSGKRIDGFAQVDLLLCNNASCSIVADLQHILPSPDDTAVPVLAMGFSGVAYDVMIANEYGFRSAAGVGMASIGKEHLESPRPNLAPAAGAWTSRLDGNASVMEVQWRVPNANLLIENREDTKPSEGPALVDLQELAMQLDNVDTAMWRQLAVGHYNNAIFYRDDDAYDDDDNDVPGKLQCVTIVWPSNSSWMIGRGWSHSDRACEEQYLAGLADRAKELPPVYLFDSYVNAAHVFLNPGVAAALKPLPDVVAVYGTAYNISVFTGSPADLAAPLKADSTSALYRDGGQYGLTYNSDLDLALPLRRQSNDHCIAICPNVSEGDIAADCGGCDVLSIGTAVIAARRIQDMRTGVFNIAKVQLHCCTCCALPREKARIHATLKCATQTPRNAAVGLREVMSTEMQLLTAIAL